MYRKCVIIAFFAVVALSSARSTTSSQTNAIPQETARADESSFASDLRFLYKIYQECSVTDLSTCLKLKLVTAMDRASRSFPVVQSEAEIEASLPRALNDREDALNSLILDKIFDFFQTHTLQVKLPSAADLQRSFAGEERGKKKKLAGLLMIPLLLGGTLIPLALGGLALLAGKALIISKLALVLAGIIGLKKLLGGGGHGHGHEEVVVASPSHGHGTSGWGRSYEKEQAQNIAYSAYAPKPSR
ncbi:Osiris 8 [Carabus blaptoides fortunei]